MTNNLIELQLDIRSWHDTGIGTPGEAQTREAAVDAWWTGSTFGFRGCPGLTNTPPDNHFMTYRGVPRLCKQSQSRRDPKITPFPSQI